MKELKNKELSVAVKEHGAELASIRCGEREYLWQADPAFWARHSPVLFPIVGSVFDKKYRTKGQEYEMGQHGFARDADFGIVSQTEDEIWFALESSAETLAKFPYAFRLEIGYRIQGRSIDVMWRVKNTGDEVLPFQIGAHPAFYWPEHDAAQAPRGYFAFESDGWKEQGGHVLKSRKLVGKGCVSATETFEVALDEQDMLALNVDTFDVLDTLIFEEQVNRVTLCDTRRNPYLSVRFEHPVVGLWSPPKKSAPFVCIEPWNGRCDSYDYAGDFADRDWVKQLEPGAEFSTKYTIEIC